MSSRRSRSCPPAAESSAVEFADAVAAAAGDGAPRDDVADVERDATVDGDGHVGSFAAGDVVIVESHGAPASAVVGREGRKKYHV